MAPSSFPVFLRRCLLAALLCAAAPCCMPDGGPEDIAAKALACFNDHYVYSSCQESYRLSAQGSINVPYAETDAYCGGPCLAETNLVLHCIEGILYNFRFYNGAYIRDVRYSLRRGCGHGIKRGDFDVLGRMEGGGYGEGFHDEYDEDYDFEGGSMLTIPLITMLLMLLSCSAFLLWAL